MDCMGTKYSSEKHKNTFLGFFSIITWSFSALFAVKLKTMPLLEVLAATFFLGFLVVFVRYLLSNKKKSFFAFKTQDFIIALAALILNQSCYLLAFRYAPAAQVDIVNYLWPTLLVCLSSFLPKERFSWSHCIACIISFLGVINLFSPSQGFSHDNILGYFLAFGAALSWTGYSLYTRYRGTSNANCISWACGPAALLTFILHLYYEKPTCPSSSEFFYLSIFGILQMGFALYFWEKALKKGYVKTLGLASYAIPIFSILILVLFKQTDFNYRMITSLLLISLSPIIPLVKSKLNLKEGCLKIRTYWIMFFWQLRSSIMNKIVLKLVFNMCFLSVLVFCEQTNSYSWDGEFSIGFSSCYGNSKKSTLSSKFKTRTEFDKENNLKSRFGVSGELQYDSEDGQSSVNKGSIGLKYTSAISPIWSWFMSEKASYDNKQDLRLRLEEAFGMGYKIVNEETYFFDIDLALARVDSDYKSKADTGYYSINPGWDFYWEISPQLKFTHDMNWLPSTKNFNNFLLNIRNALELPCYKSLSVKIEYDLDYTSKPVDNKKKVDHGITTNLVYKF
jgi:drug/metabolite transporter (DMT)-like permease/putative salt-induced outer membrane protein YdiY